MNSRLDRTKSFIQSVIQEVRANNIPFMAGSIAYQAFISLIPLLALVFLAVAVVGDQSLASEVTDYTQSFLPASAQELLGGYIEGDADSSAGGAGVIGAVTLVWGTLKIFRGLDTAFSEIYDSTAANSFVSQLTDGLIVLGTITGAIIAAVIATTAFAAFQEIPFIGLINPLVLIIGLAIVFFPMYYLFPDIEDLSPRDAVPGVIVAAGGWALLQALFQVYLEYAGTETASGEDIIGAIVLLLTWLYLSGLVLLLGAVVNAVFVGRTTESVQADSEGKQPTTEPSEATEPCEHPVAPLHADARALQRERKQLDRKRAELARDQRGSERQRNQPEDDLEAARRVNQALRDRLRWYEKPIWSRIVWWVLGYRP